MSGRRQYFWVFATLALFLVAVAQTGARVKSPVTRFTCRGRAAGYYADVDTGCQVYHMCDGLGRQFSYSCPNTTLFQQRMLVCDHWYMVNCTNSESDYDANLLIGQRDKPFVSDSDMRQRTPRPDILSVPPNSNYYDGLKEAESKFPFHPDNSIVGISESISSENDLDSDKHNYRPPTSWSMKTKRPAPVAGIDTNEDNLNFNILKPKRRDPVINIDTNEDQFDFNNEKPRFKPSFKDTNNKKEVVFKQPASEQTFEANRIRQSVKVPVPSKELVVPLPPTSDSESEEYELDLRVKTEDPVYNFIKRFDPNSPDSIKTTMTRSEIIDLNKHLPDAQVSSEEERTPRKNKNFGNNVNVLQNDKKKSFSDSTRVEKVNEKPDINTESNDNSVIVPSKELQPPKNDITPIVSTTMGPPIYYEWKWAVPAFDLEPPKLSNETKVNTTKPVKPVKRPFSDNVRTTPKSVDVKTSNTEYNISSYFVPDFVFPLDRPHPGYDDESAQTSFQVEVSRPGRASYGENPDCPQCHPAYVNPGTCEPCIVKR
ncbi:uncharacterized protein LOC112044157 [Bicyclus anynana]|uniref:Uncharacterized protein LOC112044157 n=1 Tax=Bicyclus anynana TaxID=110368 RepID=A0A6J1MMG0_BICAN|nr:uncharacterized protein LOC112044157 [Bicyclus anynana]XP_023935670.2 uncharacterized protein LOC112044157 [Bicyclus anynana]XP_023935672.2 uncharacterized protein LOC112044157 [Bicyclus anynana]XP_023935673.2 uncharacterized protein LOC112044157 [Bicyclus anynana]XP_023935674.2 uncharacterized protein LOC112044157 [Bicyclus anynana]XP_023935675.2 uncharacterized protein LOC112044157 [Bicyclus anynana]XP_023935677.2 uncharacterized protein LOC112044157 [Bicyclus anynana]